VVILRGFPTRARDDQALLSQSRFLASQARQQTAAGNATGGMLLSLDALRDESGDDEISRTRPYAVEAEQSLYEALIARHEATLLQSTTVVSAAFAADGRWVLTAQRDGSVGLWESRSGRALATLKAHGKRVTGAEFSADERRMLTWSIEEGNARIWDTRGWTVRRPTALATIAFDERPRFVALTPDGQRVVTAGFVTAHVYDAQSGKEVCALRGHKEAEEIRFGPSDTPGALGPQIRQLNPESIMSAALTMDGKLLTAARDRSARVWDLAACQQLVSFEGHKADVWLARVSANGGRAVTTSRAPAGPGEVGATSRRFSEARVWELATGKEIAAVTVEAVGFPDLALSPDGRFLVTAGSNIELWEVATATRIAMLPALTSDKVSYSRDGSRLLVTSDDGSVRLLDSTTLKQIAVHRGHSGPVFRAALSPDQGRLLSVGRDDHSARIWTIEQPAEGVYTLTADVSDHEVPGGRGRRAGIVEDGRALIVWAGERLLAALGRRAGDQTVGIVPPSST
jgi:WD40 repeat protein